MFICNAIFYKIFQSMKPARQPCWNPAWFTAKQSNSYKQPGRSASASVSSSVLIAKPSTVTWIHFLLLIYSGVGHFMQFIK